MQCFRNLKVNGKNLLRTVSADDQEVEETDDSPEEPKKHQTKKHQIRTMMTQISVIVRLQTYVAKRMKTRSMLSSLVV
jgi:hypothetical protein